MRDEGLHLRSCRGALDVARHNQPRIWVQALRVLTRLSLEIAAGSDAEEKRKLFGSAGDKETVEVFKKLSSPDPLRGPLTGNGSFRFDLIYLQQPLDIAGHDQAEIFNLKL